MSWYRTGSVSLTNGSAVVAGAGTDFVSNVRPGFAFNGPDGAVYEVQSVASAGSLTLVTPFRGATVIGAAYSVVQTQTMIAELSAQAATLLNSFESSKADAAASAAAAAHSADLIGSAASIPTYAAAAASSASDAAASSTAATASKTAAAASATTATTQATSATTSAGTATTKAAEAAASAASVLTAATVAGQQASTATTKAAESAASAVIATTQATGASTSATNAAASESNALASKNAAGASATGAAGSATAAHASEVNAGTSVTAAGASATGAAGSATAAAGSASSAATSAGTATTQAGIATTKAAEAVTSAATAAGQAAAVATSAANAATSEANALASKNAASASATAASGSATAAHTSEVNAGGSVTAAAASATGAAGSATAAAGSATSASTSAGTATTQAGVATTKAANAATSEGNAAASATAAALSAQQASSGQINSDWNAISGVGKILNKPTIPSTPAGVGLGNVENKSSAAIRAEITAANVTTALAFTPLDAAKVGAASGAAPLDPASKVPAVNLPSTDSMSEGVTNQYFTASRALAAALAGISLVTNAVISAGDTVLSALGKLQKQITDLAAGKADKASPAFSGVPTGPTAVQGTNTAQLATCAGVIAEINARQVPGGGGTATGGNVTLVVSSPAAMTVTPTAPGQYLKLPDGTTCIKGVTLFAVFNAGEVDEGIQDGAGNQLGWVRPRTGAVFGLSDNSTVAGTWTLYGVEKLGITAQYCHPNLANMGNNARRVAIDANRTCFVFGGTDCYAIVYDASAQQWGAPMLVRNNVDPGVWQAILSAANQVLVVSSKSISMEAVTLTIAGTGITVNSGTKGVATPAGQLASIDAIVAVPASGAWVFAYSRVTPARGVRAITVSGTTPIIGGEATLTPTSASFQTLLFVVGSVVRTLCGDATTVYAKPFTVTGSSLAPGTEATTPATLMIQLRAYINGNGNLVTHFVNSTHTAAIFKLTGTVESVSAVSLGSVQPQNVVGQADLVAVGVGKALFVAYQASFVTTWYCNILTDTAGVASAGAEMATVQNGVIGAVAGLIASGSSVRVAVSYSVGHAHATVDCSGSSPMLLSMHTSNNTGSSVPVPSNQYAVSAPAMLTRGTSVYCIGSGTGNDLRIGTSSYQRISGLSNATSPATGLRGGTSSETWSMGIVTSTGTLGYIIQRVEAV